MAHDKCLELATKRCDCIKDTIDELQAENKKLKKQQLTEDEIARTLESYQGLELHIATKKGFKDLAKAIIKAREDKKGD